MKTILLTLCVALGGVGYTFRDSLLLQENADPEKGSKVEVPKADPFKEVRAAVKANEVEKAIKLYKELIEKDATKKEATQELVAFYKENKMMRQAYTLQFESTANKQDREAIYKNIEKLSARTMNPKDVDFEGKRYLIQSGDTLEKIAKKFNTTSRLLKRLNKIKDARKIKVNQAIKVIEADTLIKVSLSEKKLYLYQKDGLFKIYSVGVGKESTPTPAKDFMIMFMQTEPKWYKDDGEIIPAGDPRNSLGTRWMSFGNEKNPEYKSFGIHGTNKPESIGKKSSMGCVRMHNEDVEELYDFCRQFKTKVLISE